MPLTAIAIRPSLTRKAARREGCEVVEVLRLGLGCEVCLRECGEQYDCNINLNMGKIMLAACASLHYK